MYDSELLQISLAATLLFLLLCVSVVMLIIRYKNQVKEFELKAQQLTYEMEKKELRMSFNERELVLDEVSKEIHDNIGQIMFLIRRNLYTIEKQGGQPEQLKLIRNVADLADQVIRVTRHMGYSLDTSFIKQRGLYSMLEYDMETINATKQLNCSIEVSGKNSLKAEEELLVYRIAQEAMHNVLKYAEASHLGIFLKYESDSFTLSITDDGTGFDYASINQEETIGIKNMYRRASLLNGSLTIVSEPGNGCCVTLKFKHPL